MLLTLWQSAFKVTPGRLYLLVFASFNRLTWVANRLELNFSSWLTNDRVASVLLSQNHWGEATYHISKTLRPRWGEPPAVSRQPCE